MTAPNLSFYSLTLLRTILVFTAVASLYGFWNPRWRNAISGDFLRLRGWKRTGAPASIRTHILSFILWLYAVLWAFEVSSWVDPNPRHNPLLIALLIATTASSQLDIYEYTSKM